VEGYTPKGYIVYLDNQKDEIYEILQRVISDNKLTQIKSVANINELANIDEKVLVVLWSDVKMVEYEKLDIEYVNLLDRINKL
jgi:hypothetical protein